MEITKEIEIDCLNQSKIKEPRGEQEKLYNEYLDKKIRKLQQPIQRYIPQYINEHWTIYDTIERRWLDDKWLKNKKTAEQECRKLNLIYNGQQRGNINM